MTFSAVTTTSSPISKVPNEVIRIILVMVHNWDVEDTEICMKISTVCSKWRYVALETSEIWKEIYIDTNQSWKQLEAWQLKTRRAGNQNLDLTFILGEQILGSGLHYIIRACGMTRIRTMSFQFSSKSIYPCVQEFFRTSFSFLHNPIRVKVYIPDDYEHPVNEDISTWDPSTWLSGWPTIEELVIDSCVPYMLEADKSSPSIKALSVCPTDIC
jgi:hypothetical protein